MIIIKVKHRYAQCLQQCEIIKSVDDNIPWNLPNIVVLHRGAVGNMQYRGATVSLFDGRVKTGRLETVRRLTTKHPLLTLVTTWLR
jgi:hypothetical protein